MARARPANSNGGLAIDITDYNFECGEYRANAEAGARWVSIVLHQGNDTVGRHDVGETVFGAGVGGSVSIWQSDPNFGLAAQSIVFTSGFIEIEGIDEDEVRATAELGSGVLASLSGKIRAIRCPSLGPSPTR